MRRLWMSLLLVPVIGLAMPTVAMAASLAPSAPTALSAPVAKTRVLQLGMSGSAVKTLQRRLAALKYYPGSIDGRFGTNTLEAVWAFQEVQGLPGEDYVSSAMQRALAHPRAPKVLDRAAGANRIEVNLASEVLVLYHKNKIQLISHVSSGRRLLLLLARRRLRVRHHADRQLQDRRLHARLGPGPARRDVQPGVLHRHRVRDPR